MQITPTEFQETINEINEILVNAYSLTRSFMDHTLAILTLYLSMLVIDKNLKPLMQLAVFGILAPFGANAAGWIFTEMGRQPFVVAPNPTGVDGVHLFTAAAVSPGVTAGELIASLASFAAVYGLLLVVEVFLLVRTIRGGVAAVVPELDPPATADREDDVLAFAY